MLEQPQLWLPDLNSQTMHPLLGEKAGPPLGLVQWVAGSGFFSSAILEVREFDDAPLLFRAQRAWTILRRYTVYDADDHFVGSVQKDALLAPSGREVVWRIAEKETVAYYLAGGPLLATETRNTEGHLLQFGSGEGSRNPFLRMLVVAAAFLL